MIKNICEDIIAEYMCINSLFDTCKELHKEYSPNLIKESCILRFPHMNISL